MIVEERFQDWRGQWRAAIPDTLELVRAVVDEHPPNAAAYEVANAAPAGCATCVVPDRQLVGIAAQVYSLWSDGSQGIGDLADVAELARTSNADVLLLSPLHAPGVGSPQQPSPYYPSSRQFRNPLHLRVDGLRVPTRRGALVDRDAVWAAKREVLLQEWRGFGGDVGYEAYVVANGNALAGYAEFCARAGDPAGFHMWLQWRLDEQLRAAAAAGAGLVHDVAVGVDPAGADAERWRELVAPGFRIGAPPDELNGDGQDWGLPPFVPERLVSAGYEPILAALDAASEHGVGMRVDHVMGLFRQYWIPDGATPADGVYVRYPAAEILDRIAALSAACNVFVVGEDLGTVEPGVRTALAARRILSYKVMRFEDDPPETWPRLAMASVATHDMPTIAATGESPAEQHARLLRARCAVIVLTADDLVGATAQPNKPGTTDAENWSQPLPVDVGGVAAAFAAQTQRPRPDGS